MTVKPRKRSQFGFGLVETLLAVALFISIGVSMYQTYASVFGVVQVARARTAAVSLLNEEMEVIRNMPYADIGVKFGIPSGNLPATKTELRGAYQFQVDTVVRNIDDPFDGQLGSTTYNDLSPADSKLVELRAQCINCQMSSGVDVSVTARVGPRNLESASTNGSLFIHVIDASGLPVEGASVRVENASSSILINDTTNSDGTLAIIDAPPGTEVYQITVTKSGYTTDRSYATGSTTAPVPIVTNPTVVVQNITETTLTIDRESIISAYSVAPDCSAISSIDFDLTGTRLISNAPSSILKYDQSHTTDVSGEKQLLAMEWDTYTFSVTGGAYDLAGTIPLSPLVLSPGVNQNLYFVMRPQNPMALVVTVKDSATQLPVAGAVVEIENQTTSAITTLVTGRGFLRQTDWSAGAGQATTSDTQMYWTDNGQIDTLSPAGDLKLANTLGIYSNFGTLESSTYDTGSPSNFYEFLSLPISQPVEVEYPGLAFQIATGNDGSTSTWSYLGPDGTSATYYTPTSTTISSVHNGDRYFRYKAYLTTASTTFTPILSDASFTFTSSCVPPGQVYFDGLTPATYDITVSKDGYATTTDTVVIGSNWQEKEIILAP